jgi:hypothetical protein
VLTQTGSKLTWYAHALDNKTWAHDFTGTISADKYSGTYQDRAGYDRHFHGTIDGRIRDKCHITVHLTVAENGDEIIGLSSKVRPCRRRPSRSPSPCAATRSGRCCWKFAAHGLRRILLRAAEPSGEGKVIQIDKGDIHSAPAVQGPAGLADVLLRIRVGGEYWVAQEAAEQAAGRGRRVGHQADASSVPWPPSTAFPPDFIVAHHVCGREIGLGPGHRRVRLGSRVR